MVGCSAALYWQGSGPTDTQRHTKGCTHTPLLSPVFELGTALPGEKKNLDGKGRGLTYGTSSLAGTREATQLIMQP